MRPPLISILLQLQHALVRHLRPKFQMTTPSLSAYLPRRALYGASTTPENRIRPPPSSFGSAMYLSRDRSMPSLHKKRSFQDFEEDTCLSEGPLSRPPSRIEKRRQYDDGPPDLVSKTHLPELRQSVDESPPNGAGSPLPPRQSGLTTRSPIEHKMEFENNSLHNDALFPSSPLLWKATPLSASGGTMPMDWDYDAKAALQRNRSL